MLRTELIRPVHELLLEHATRLGGKTAYSDGRRRLTYAALERRTARLAGHPAFAGLPAITETWEDRGGETEDLDRMRVLRRRGRRRWARR